MLQATKLVFLFTQAHSVQQKQSPKLPSLRAPPSSKLGASHKREGRRFKQAITFATSKRFCFAVVFVFEEKKHMVFKF